MTMEHAMSEDLTSSSQQCPGCNRPIDPLRAPAVSVLSGKIVHFCSSMCREAFLDRAPKADTTKEAVLEAMSGETEPSKETSKPATEEPNIVIDTPFPHLKLYPSALVRPQIINLSIWAVVLCAVVFVPGLINGRLPVLIAAAAVLGMAIRLFWRDRHVDIQKLL
jgi:hypothetical protein